MILVLFFPFSLANMKFLPFISSLTQTNNLSLRANQKISCLLRNHPIFTLSNTDSNPTISIFSTKFSKIYSHVIYSNRENIHIYNSVFENSIQPIYLNSESQKTATSYKEEIDYRDRIKAENKNITFTKCSFHSLQINPTQDDETSGGAVFCNNVLISFDDCFFAGNRANSGGACAFSSSTISFNNCNFSLNKAMSDGGAISLDRSNMTITNCNFLKNQAEMSAGVIRSTRSITNCENSVFQENSDLITSSVFEAEYSKIHLQSVIFNDNICKFQRGGVIISLKKSTVELYLCTISLSSKKDKKPFTTADNSSQIITKGSVFDISLEQILRYISKDQFHDSSTNKYSENLEISKLPIQQPFDIIEMNVEGDTLIFTKTFLFNFISVLVTTIIIIIFVLIKPVYATNKAEYRKA